MKLLVPIYANGHQHQLMNVQLVIMTKIGMVPIIENVQINVHGENGNLEVDVHMLIQKNVEIVEQGNVREFPIGKTNGRHAVMRENVRLVQ